MKASMGGDVSHGRPEWEIPAATSLAAVHLTVRDLERSLRYYREAIGLAALRHENGQASLGVGDRELLVLVEEPGARPANGYTGLFHFAIRVPQRRDLATWLAHAVRDRVSLAGASDHFVSEAIYLQDPDGHGIEIYCDRPRALWEGNANLLGTWPLDSGDLLGELDDPASGPFDRLPDGTDMGHVHLRVADVDSTIAFYRDVLGFALMAQLGDQAAFLSAGGYHHHVGGNVWESRGAAPPPTGMAALRHATIVLPAEKDREALMQRLVAAGQETFSIEGLPATRDPSGNAVAFDIVR
jgi:catechol 2,3-dioxygenase